MSVRRRRYRSTCCAKLQIHGDGLHRRCTPLGLGDQIERGAQGAADETGKAAQAVVQGAEKAAQAVVQGGKDAVQVIGGLW